MKQKGIFILEMALALPILLFIAFGFVNLGLVIHDKEVSESIAREAARMAVYNYAEGEEDNSGAGVLVRKNIKERCEQQLFVYHYDEANTKIESNLSGSGYSNKQARPLRIVLVVARDYEFSIFGTDIFPETLKSSIVMERENHVQTHIGDGGK